MRSFFRSSWLAQPSAVLAVSLALCGSVRLPAQRVQPGNRELEVVQIRSNFYVIAGAGGNIAVQIGSLGAVLVDTGVEAMSDKVIAAVGTITNLPIRYIINTSADADHVGGNQKVSKAGASVLWGNLGNASFAEDVLTNGGAASVLAHENVLQRMSGPDKAAEPLWPSKVYTGRGYSMYMNDASILILHQPAAHSDGDSIVEFRQSDAIVIGDIVDLRHFPVVDPAKGGSIQGEIDALNRLLDMVVPPFPFVWQEGRTYVVPGHGHVMDREDLADYRDMVTIARDLIQDLIKQRMTLEQVKAANPLKAFRTRYGADTGPWTTDMFIEAIYKSLTSAK